MTLNWTESGITAVKNITPIKYLKMFPGLYFLWSVRCPLIVSKDYVLIPFHFAYGIIAWRNTNFILKSLATLQKQTIRVIHYPQYNSYPEPKFKSGRLRGLAVACWTTDHYHPCSNPGVGISECCFVLSLRLITFGGRSANLAYLVHKSGRETSIIIIEV